MKNLLAIASSFLMTSFSTVSNNDYTIVKQDKHIVLYERWIQQGASEKVRELKAVFEVRSTAAKLVKLLQNSHLGTQWNPHAKVYKIIPVAQPDQWINYVKYAMPWPFDDQDCCILFSKDNNNQVSFTSTHANEYPAQKNITRINMVKGRWTMEEKGNGLLQVVYIISTAKSKKVPAWVSDPVVRKNMMETMNAFKKLLENA